MKKLEAKLAKYYKLVVINKFQRVPSNYIMYLWNVFAESRLGYGCFIFATPFIQKDVMTKFGQIYNKSLKITLGLSMKTPEKLICHVAGVLTWR